MKYSINWNHAKDSVSGALGISNTRQEELVKDARERLNRADDERDGLSKSEALEISLEGCNNAAEVIYMAFHTGYFFGRKTMGIMTELKDMLRGAKGDN